MFRRRPVLRARRDPLAPTRETTGSKYRLWTTLKVPQGFSMREALPSSSPRRPAPTRVHAHAGEAPVRPGRGPRPPARHGARQRAPTSLAPCSTPNIVELTRAGVARAGARSSASSSADEIARAPVGGARRRRPACRWRLLRVARGLNERRRHRPLLHLPRARQAARRGERVTRYNALFHWAVPPGREIEPAARSAATTS